MNLLKSKITRKYFMTMFIVLFITLTAVYVFTVNITEGSLRQQTQERDSMIASSTQRKIELSLETVINDMRTAGINAAHGYTSLYEAEIYELLARQGMYLFIQSFDADGKPISVLPPRNQAFDAHGITDRVKWSRTHYITDMFKLDDGTPVIAVGYPAIDENGVYAGAVAAFINLNAFSRIVSESKIGDEGFVAVLDQQGTIIASSIDSEIGTSMKSHPLGRLLNLQRAGIWTGDLFGKEMLVAYRPMYLGSYGLISGESVKQAQAIMSYVVNALLKGFAVIVIVASGLALFQASRIVSPVMNLIGQIDEYKDKKRSVFESPSSGDELERLSLTLGDMAKELTEREQRLFYILESIPYAVITLNENGIITTFNESAEKLSGLYRADLIEKPLSAISPYLNETDGKVLKTLEEGKTYEEFESYIIDNKGERRDIKLHSSPYSGGVLLILRDISDIKQLETIIHRNEQLSSLGQMTAGIAHELKNPLSIIHAAAEGIQLEKSSETVNSYAGDILSTTERMNSLIINFLNLVHPTEDEVPYEKTDIAEVLRELIHLIKKQTHDHVEITATGTNKAAWISGNRNSLTQVFLNILLNAVQSMQESGKISIAVEDKDSNWLISVADSGPGIPQERLKRIFNPFFSTKSDGTGLGLAITNEIITEHDGHIWAESEPGQGATFFVSLPKWRSE